MSSTSRSLTGLAVSLRYGILSCLLLLLPLGAWADELRVTLLPSREGGAYQRVIEAIQQQVRQSADKTVSLSTVSLEEYARHSTDIEQESDLLVSIGMRATDSVARRHGSTPLLATLVPYSGLAASLNKIDANSASAEPRSISAILLDQPVSRPLSLTRLLLGKHKPIGIPLGPDSRRQQLEIERVAARLGLSIEIETIDSPANLMHHLSRLLERSDVLLALPDPAIFNRQSVRHILLSSYRKRVPVIGFSRSYVTAGALAAAYSTPRQIGRQAGEIIVSLHNDVARLPAAFIEPRYFSVSINGQVARSFGFTEISAERLKREIMRLEGREE